MRSTQYQNLSSLAGILLVDLNLKWLRGGGGGVQLVLCGSSSHALAAYKTEVSGLAPQYS
jgi:hypothetical protein